MNRYDFNAVVLDTYRHLDQYVNNFKKIESVKSDLLWGNQQKIENPWLSVIIPTYNRTGLLKEAIDSVLSQKSVDFMWEVIVIDNTPLDEDGSTPALRIIEKQNDSRILYFHNEENIGSGYNWNRGVEKARGTWVSFLHDDDILYPDALRNIRRILMQRKNSSKPVGYLQARVDEFTDGEKAIRKPCNQRKYILELTRLGTLITYYTRTGTPTCGTTILKQAFLNCGGINYDFGPTADAVLGYQIMRDYTVIMSDCTFGGYRWGANESLRIETAKKLIYADHLLAEYCYKLTVFSKIWGSVFEKAQLDMNLRVKIRSLEKNEIYVDKKELMDPTFSYKTLFFCDKIYWICSRSYRVFCCIKAIVKGFFCR